MTRKANPPSLPVSVDRNVKRAIEELHLAVESLRSEADILHAADVASRNRANHTGTQPVTTVTGLDAIAETAKKAALDAVKANAVALTEEQRLDLTDSGDSTLHYHASDRNRANHTGAQSIATVTGLQTALDGKEPANANIQTHIASSHLTGAQVTDLTDSGDSTLHYHSSDRNRANHSGSQAISTITNLQTSLDNLTAMITDLTADLALITALSRTKSTTYASSTAPAMAYIGDLWFDLTTPPNKYRCEDRLAGGNAISTNPSFESGLWAEEFGPGNGTASLVTGWNGTGSAMRITATHTTNAYGRVSTRNMTLNAGEYVHLTCRVRANRRLNLNYFYIMHATGGWNVAFSIPVATTSWQQVMMSTVIPAAHSATVYAVMAAIKPGTSGVLQNDWIEVDDFVLTPGALVAR